MIKVFYHADCMDGFCAAVVARAGILQRTDDEFELIPAQYHYTKPPSVDGEEVYILDFSFQRRELEAMAGQARRLVVLDHHLTARDDLAGEWPSNCDIQFDMQRSGAGMTWDYFFAKTPRPLLVDLIEDRDLWKFERRGSRQLHFALQLMGFNVDRWTELLDDRHEVLEAIELGRKYEDHHNWCVDQFVSMAIKGLIGEYEVPMANAPYWFASDVAGKLAEDAPFAATFFKRDERVSVSLRSRGAKGLDVGNIAKAYGGGGHANAAGFQVDNLAVLGL